MRVIQINEPTISRQLRKLALDLGAVFYEDFGASKLELDNEYGKGYINSYDISPFLSARTYNITFKKEIRFIKDESRFDTVYFLYALKGYIYHKFADEEEVMKVGQMQNVIIRGKSKKNVIVFPADVPLKISALFLLNPKEVSFDDEESHSKYFEKTILDTIKHLEESGQEKYFGQIDTSTAKYAEFLIDNERTDVVGRLMSKASTINTLASQFQNYKENEERPDETSPLDSDELNGIIELSTYIGNNLDKELTIANLSKRSGLSPKKLQQGFKFLFGDTLNNIIKNIRLEHAKELIQSTNMNISEVCFAIGFNSRSYFSKIFDERFGLSPSEFKQRFLKEDVVFELSYRSQRAANTTQNDVEDILKEARDNNKTLNVTGCLVCYKDYFFQILEGSKKTVLELFDSIEKDVRHFDVIVLHQGIKINRLFGDFSMAALSKPNDFKVNINGQLKDINFSQMTTNLKEPGIASDIFWMRVCNMLKVTD